MSVTDEALEWLLGRCEAHTDYFRVLQFQTKRHIKCPENGF